MIENPQAIWHLDNSYAHLSDCFYTKTAPTPVTKPKLKRLNHELAKRLGLDVGSLAHPDGIEILAGNRLPHNSIPIAQAYAGHQYKTFRDLGDGRAILLGEQLTPDGKRFDIHLKGAGMTPYSKKVYKNGDGRAALGPMLREYILSAAMEALGIPTSHSLAVVATGETMIRKGEELPGAILVRVASSHIRFGTLQYAAKWCGEAKLREIVDYTIARHFPEVAAAERPYLAFFEKVIERQASLIANWQLIGFIHGVQNTDNVMISGETLDYGPCAFMDTYKPLTWFSSIDRHGRYAYVNQPSIGRWNIERLKESLMPLFAEDEATQERLADEAVATFDVQYEQYWLQGMRKKLGMYNEEAEDRELIDALLMMMERQEADYTNTFLDLTFGEQVSGLSKDKHFESWYTCWQQRLSRQQASTSDIKQLMKASNPAVVPRNHQVEQSLEAAVAYDDYTVMEELMDVWKEPFAHTDKQRAYRHVPKQDTPYITYCGT